MVELVVTSKRLLLVALASVRCLMFLLVRRTGARRSCKSVAAYAANAKLRDEPYAELYNTLLSIIGRDAMVYRQKRARAKTETPGT